MKEVLESEEEEAVKRRCRDLEELEKTQNNTRSARRE